MFGLNNKQFSSIVYMGDPDNFLPSRLQRGVVFSGYHLPTDPLILPAFQGSTFTFFPSISKCTAPVASNILKRAEAWVFLGISA